MSAKPLRGADSRTVPNRHGRTGYVPLSACIPWRLKDELVDHCAERGVTLRDAIEDAIRRHLKDGGA